LQRAIFNSANFSSIATDAKGVIQIFNVGAERMLGHTGADVMNKITPADIEQAIRTLTRAILERAGYRVLAASTATDAEALFAQEAGGIDLLVTDIALPDGTGPALFKRLFEKRPSLRVLYISGYMDETVVDQAALERAGGFLQKPFLADGLARKVREALDR
jgi:DNA-binding NtrC family response regulator